MRSKEKWKVLANGLMTNYIDNLFASEYGALAGFVPNPSIVEEVESLIDIDGEDINDFRTSIIAYVSHMISLNRPIEWDSIPKLTNAIQSIVEEKHPALAEDMRLAFRPNIRSIYEPWEPAW